MSLATACADPGPGASPVAATPGPVTIRTALPPIATQSPLAPTRAVAVVPEAPTITPGTGVVLGPGRADRPPETTEAGDITLNFVDTDLREVVRAVLGDVLHLNYVIDPKVQATITVQTSQPLRREQVLPTLQEVLRASGLALIETAGVYRVVALDEVARSGGGTLVVGQGARARLVTPSYNVQIFPLKYASASTMQRTIEPLLPRGAALQVDATRNLLILSGAGQDLSTITDLVRSFDVDWLAGMSFGIFPLHLGSPRAIVADLETIFGPSGTVPLGEALRFQPLERMNAVLVVSPQQAYLDQARQWIERLDNGSNENTPRLFEYHVQNSRAVDVAKVLSALFSSGQITTVEPQTAPEQSFTQNAPSGFSGLNGGLSGSLGAGGGLSATPAQQNTAPPASPAPSAAAASPTAPAGRPQSPGLQDALSNAFAGDKGSNADTPQVRIVADEKNNTLVIYARPRDYRMIEEALAKIDVMPLQVLIEATIAEVTLNDNLQYGLQWFLQRGNNALSNVNPATGATGLIPQIVPGFNYQFLTKNIDVVLSALSTVTDVNIISSPQLLVLDHHAAMLQVGDDVPVPTAQIQSVASPGAPIVNTVQYLNTGVILHVSPRVNANGAITLDISQEVSQVTNQIAAGGINAPTISERRIQSTVTVSDGETLALGGLIQDSRTLGNTGIPLLKDIPVLGALFGTRQDQKMRTELLILLSPRVLHDANEARIVTDELRSRLHTIAPLVNRTQ